MTALAIVTEQNSLKGMRFMLDEYARPPVPRAEQRIKVLHGDVTLDSYGWLRDSYGWLREEDSPEALAYLQAENNYADQATVHLSKLKALLAVEVEGRQLSQSEVPFTVGPFEYFQRSDPALPHLLWWRRLVSGGPPELVLDPNSIPGADVYFALGVLEPSDDGRYVAFSFDVTGDEGFELRVRDLENDRDVWCDSKRFGPGRTVGRVVWTAGGRTLLFTRERTDMRRLHDQVIRLDLQTGESAVVFEETDERLEVLIRRSASGAWVFLDVRPTVEEYGKVQPGAVEVWCLPADQPSGNWRRILSREFGHYVFAEHWEDSFLFRTNDAGPYCRLVRAPIDDPSPSRWEEVVSHRHGVVLEEVHVLEDHVVILEREGLSPRLVARDRGGYVTATIVPDEASCTLEVGRSAGGSYSVARHPFRGCTLTYMVTSFVTLDTVFEYNLENGRKTVLSQVDIAGYDSADYVAKVVMVRAEDGVDIPISLVARRDRVSPGPMLLQAYATSGVPNWPSMSRSPSHMTERLSLLDRGFAFGIVHARGGGELGRPWHDAAMGDRKRTTFTDLIAAAEGLIECEIASPGGVAIQGKSSGGATVLATATLRPDLFRAVVASVPVADILDTALNASMPFAAQETAEYGDPHDPEAYRSLLTYDPYYNLAADRPLPPTFIDTALNDSQVPWFQPARYVAQRRSCTANRDRGLVFRVRTVGGHRGVSHGAASIEDAAFLMAWVLDQFGHSS